MIEKTQTIVQIAGHNIFNIDFREYLKRRYPQFKSYLYKYTGTIEYADKQGIKIINTNKRFTTLQQVIQVFQILKKTSAQTIKVAFFVEEYINTFITALLAKKNDDIYYFKVDWPYDHHSLTKRLIYRCLISNVERYIFSKSKRILCLNQAILNKVVELNTDPENISKFGLMLPLITDNPKVTIKKNNEFLFFGMLRSDQNIDKIVGFVFYLKKRGLKPLIHFFGEWISQDYKLEILKLIEKRKLDSNVLFHGYADSNDSRLIKLAKRCQFGFAYFDNNISSHVYYAWPSKILFYLKYHIAFFFKRGSSAVERDILNTGYAMALDQFDYEVMYMKIRSAKTTNNKKSLSFYNNRSINQYF